MLFLGAFLLFISALILIVFNWASFSPILQFALIAGVCGGFWAGGAWLIRNTDLDRAGAGLQAVGGVLVPVVAFSLSRPGLLDLAPRWGWLLASLLCVPIYAFAAWRLRRPIYSGAAFEPDHRSTKQALALIATGEIDVEPLITHTLPFTRVMDAYELAHSRGDNCIKVLVEIPGRA